MAFENLGGFVITKCKGRKISFDTNERMRQSTRLIHLLVTKYTIIQHINKNSVLFVVRTQGIET